MTHRRVNILVFGLCVGLLSLPTPSLALPKATHYIRISANLDDRTELASPQPENPTWSELQQLAQFTLPVLVYDDSGTAHVLRLFFFHSSKAAGPVSAWFLKIYVEANELSGNSGDDPILLTSTPLVFDANRRLPRLSGEIFADWTTAGPSTLTLTFIETTVLDMPSSISTLYQDGCASNCPKNGGADFDGDAISDIGIWRPSVGFWAILKSTTNNFEFIWKQWGLPGDIPLPGDYTGDGISDFTVWRPKNGNWYVCESQPQNNDQCASSAVLQFGLPGDIPLSGDYDGDGTFDLAVWRQNAGLFIFKSSKTGQVAVKQWGLPGDVPLGR